MRRKVTKGAARLDDDRLRPAERGSSGYRPFVAPPAPTPGPLETPSEVPAEAGAERFGRALRAVGRARVAAAASEGRPTTGRRGGKAATAAGVAAVVALGGATFAPVADAQAPNRSWSRAAWATTGTTSDPTSRPTSPTTAPSSEEVDAAAHDVLSLLDLRRGPDEEALLQRLTALTDQLLASVGEGQGRPGRGPAAVRATADALAQIRVLAQALAAWIEGTGPSAAAPGGSTLDPVGAPNTASASPAQVDSPPDAPTPAPDPTGSEPGAEESEGAEGAGSEGAGGAEGTESSVAPSSPAPDSEIEAELSPLDDGAGAAGHEADGGLDHQVDEATGDEAPGDEAPGDEAPGDEAPGDEAPAPATAEPVSAASASLDTAAAPSLSDQETQFLALLDAQRAKVGRPPLALDAGLVASARTQAADIAAAGALFHQDLVPLLDPWQTVGENVGYGPTVEAINSALVDSPGHYANMVNVDFTHVGIGVVVTADGRIWVSQVFGG